MHFFKCSFVIPNEVKQLKTLNFSNIHPPKIEVFFFFNLFFLFEEKKNNFSKFLVKVEQTESKYKIKLLKVGQL